MKSQGAKWLLSLDWDFATGQHVWVSILSTMFRKTGFVFIKTFPFLLVWVLALLVSELDFWWWPPSSLIEILYSFVKDSFHFLRNCFFPELLHTLGLHKFVGSISGVVSMNTACILKMILEWIHLGRPLCHRCKNFKASCRYTLFTVRMSRMLSRWRVLSVCLCKTSACLFSSGRSIIAEEMHRWNASSPLLC